MGFVKAKAHVTIGLLGGRRIQVEPGQLIEVDQVQPILLDRLRDGDVHVSRLLEFVEEPVVEPSAEAPVEPKDETPVESGGETPVESEGETPAELKEETPVESEDAAEAPAPRRRRTRKAEG